MSATGVTRQSERNRDPSAIPNCLVRLHCRQKNARNVIADCADIGVGIDSVIDID
jgi:hypothetical protein